MLSAARKTQELVEGRFFSRGVAAGVTCYQGGMAILVAGYARPGRPGQGGSTALQQQDVAGYVCDGIFTATAVGGVADGSVAVGIKRGTFAFKNSAATDAVTNADVGNHCFVVDDETVARTSANDTRCIAGVIAGIDETGAVMVEIGGKRDAKRKIYIPFAINQTDLLAHTSAEIAVPVAGNVTRMQTIVQAAVTTGGDMTVSVNGTAVAGIDCAVANGAAKGVTASSTATAGDASRACKPGDRLQIIPSGAFAAAGAVSGVVEISY